MFMKYVLASLLAVWLLTACHHSTGAADGAKTAAAKSSQPEDDGKGPVKDAGKDADDDDDDKDKDKQGVTLTADQVGKLGITVEPAKALEHRDEAIGYGVVMNHDAIAQAAADLTTAEATARLSSSSLARARKLKGTPGAVSADVEETAAQKSEVDAAALIATQQKLSSIFGMNPPWKKGDTGGAVQALAGGRYKLLRATFPVGTLPDEDPTTIRAARIGTVKAGSGWRSSDVWDAPADTTVPGRSFFALLKTQEPREGERLQVFAPVGAASSGVVVPGAAAILSGGKYWCYVQKSPGTFSRVEIDTSTPVADGYFVKEGIAAGDNIVTSAAGQLLAKETGAAAEPD
jgi:hypothetical protein